jgi:hypothetical protein
VNFIFFSHNKARFLSQKLFGANKNIFNVVARKIIENVSWNFWQEKKNQKYLFRLKKLI